MPFSLAGLKQTFGNAVNFTYAKGSNVDYDATFRAKMLQCLVKKYIQRQQKQRRKLKSMVDVASKADVILLAIGETAEMSGESSSRTNISIPQAQKIYW